MNDKKHQDYVAGFLFTNDLSKVALIRKNKPADQFGKLNGVGGKIEFLSTLPEGEIFERWETPQEAMIREFHEETGLSITTWRMFCDFQDMRDYKVYFFMAVLDGAGEPKFDCEAEKVEWFPVGHLYAFQIMDNLRWLIPLALDKNVHWAKVGEMPLLEDE